MMAEKWFTCLNVGDDYEAKDDRRKDKDLTIPAYSLVEIVGVRPMGETKDNISSTDHFVLEVRLPLGGPAPGQDEEDADGNVPQYVTMGRNYAFTGPASIDKLRFGQLTYPPCLCRFEGTADDTSKIQGRYIRPENSKLPDSTLDGYEALFSGGTLQQLIGDPKGHLKLPNDLPKASKFRLQSQLLGWNALGVYKYHTGEKIKGKSVDKDESKNLLVMVAPAAQVMQRPSVKFITLEPYSTYAERTYGNGSYDLDGDNRDGQKYAMMVDGDNPVPVAFLYKDPDGNHKQLITFKGDNIFGTIKLILEGQSTTDIDLTSSVLTEAYLTTKLEALSNVGQGNVKVTIWPGRWLIEFIGDLAGSSFDQFEIDRISSAVYEVFALDTDWNDSGMTGEVSMPYPLEGEYDGDDSVVNDAVAAGSFGWANDAPGIGYVAANVECRNYNGDGTPNL